MILNLKAKNLGYPSFTTLRLLCNLASPSARSYNTGYTTSLRFAQIRLRRTSFTPNTLGEMLLIYERYNISNERYKKWKNYICL